MTKIWSLKTADQLPMINTPMFVITISGIWCPLWWPLGWNFAYYFYSVFAVFMVFTHFLSELINLIIEVNTLSDFVRKCLSLIPVTNACCKGLNILLNRRKIIAILNMLDSNNCRIRNVREMHLQQKYERLIRWFNFTCLIVDVAAVVALLVHPFMSNSDEKELPFKAWFPFAVDTEMTFWIMFIYETLAGFLALGWLAGNDLLIISIILEICRQMDMLCGRLSDLTNFMGTTKQHCHDNYILDNYEQAKIKEKFVDCVAHHIFIFELAEATQDCFVPTFIAQMIASVIGTCTCAYHLTQYAIFSSDFNKAGLMFLTITIELFLFCWFGNELHLKSLEVGDAVYKMDWFNLKTSLRKDLINIVTRSRQPITFRSVPTVPLSIEVFISILQTSYSVFTLLTRIGVKSSDAMLSDL